MRLCCLPPNYTFISLHRLCTAVLKADVLAVVVRCFFSYNEHDTGKVIFLLEKQKKAF